MKNGNKRSLVDLALDKAQKVLQVGSEAADVLIHLQGGATPLGLAAVGMRVVNSVRVHRARSPQEFFGEGWKPLDLGVLESNIYRALVADAAAVLEEIPGLSEHSPAVAVAIDAIRVGFAVRGDGDRHGAETEGCWLPQGQDRDATVSRLGRSLWESLKSSSVLATPIPDADHERLALVAAKKETLFPSRRGDALYERIKKFLDRGYHRSLFVVGAPGVGKTAMLKYIASLHGGFMLRVQLGDLGDIRPTSLARAVEVLRPDVLIIDDFDRFVMGDHGHSERGRANSNAASLLDPVERINKVVPIFMVSANFSEEITKAMLRPERFDVLAIVEELDPEIYERLLPDAPRAVLAELKRVKAPVAYVEELRKRVHVLGYADAAKEMRELMRRAERILRLNKKSRANDDNRSSLIGKSPRQRAGLLERRAARDEKMAGSLIEKADKARVRAETHRARAEDERRRAVAHDEKVKVKVKVKAKGKGKRKGKGTGSGKRKGKGKGGRTARPPTDTLGGK